MLLIVMETNKAAMLTKETGINHKGEILDVSETEYFLLAKNSTPKE